MMYNLFDDYLLLGGECVLARSADEVIRAARDGYAKDRVFYLSPAKEGLSNVLPLCRCVAENTEQLRMIGSIADTLVTAGVVLGDRGFCDIDEIKSAAKNLHNISIRGCFVYADGADIWSRGYQAAKRLSAALPTGIPYIGYLGAVAMLSSLPGEERARSLKSAEITAKQNATAFYAKLFVS